MVCSNIESCSFIPSITSEYIGPAEETGIFREEDIGMSREHGSSDLITLSFVCKGKEEKDDYLQFVHSHLSTFPHRVR